MRVYNEREWWLVASQWLPSHGSVVYFILPQVFFAGLMSGAAILSREFGDFAGTFDPPLEVFYILGSVLAVLLSVRVALSLTRYNAAWTAFMNVGGKTRNFVRTLHMIAHDSNPDAVASIERHSMVFMATTKALVRGTHDVTDPRVVSPALLLPEETAFLAQDAGTRPYVLAAGMAASLRDLRVTDAVTENEYLHLSSLLNEMTDAVQDCRRVLFVPLPFCLAQITYLYTASFCFSLPFALVSRYEHYTSIPTLAVAFLFFGIHAAGVFLEEPFGSVRTALPLELEQNSLNEDVDFLFSAMLVRATGKADPFSASLSGGGDSESDS